jgi:hypothetical protein
VQLFHQPQALLYEQVLFDDGYDQDLPVAPDLRDLVRVSIELDSLDLDRLPTQAVLEEHMFFVDNGSDLHPPRFRPAFFHNHAFMSQRYIRIARVVFGH